MDIKVEVRYQSIIGQKQPTLDEVVLYVNGECLFHLEQMDDNQWWMGVGTPDGQFVHVNLVTTRARIRGSWEDDGAVAADLTLDGKPWERLRGGLWGRLWGLLKENGKPASCENAWRHKGS